jgi:hypothetical protein
MVFDRIAREAYLQSITEQQLSEQHPPSAKDLKHNPKAIPSTYHPPAYQITKSRRNLAGDYSLMTHKFDGQHKNK